MPPAAPPITGKQTSYQFQVHLLLENHFVTELPSYGTTTDNMPKSDTFPILKTLAELTHVHSQNWIVRLCHVESEMKL